MKILICFRCFLKHKINLEIIGLILKNYLLKLINKIHFLKVIY